MQNVIHIVSWPAAAGKTTVCNALLEQHADLMERIVTTTSRTKREGEIDGIHYHFLPREEFEIRAENGEFIEYAAVHTNFYGSTEAELRRILNKGKAPLYNIDVQGMVHLKAELHKRGYTVKTYFLDAPMIELERRLLSRGTENEESLRIRLATTLVEKEQSSLYDEIVENLDLEIAIATLAKKMGLAK